MCYFARLCAFGFLCKYIWLLNTSFKCIIQFFFYLPQARAHIGQSLFGQQRPLSQHSHSNLNHPSDASSVLKANPSIEISEVYEAAYWVKALSAQFFYLFIYLYLFLFCSPCAARLLLTHHIQRLDNNLPHRPERRDDFIFYPPYHPAITSLHSWPTRICFLW